MDDEDKIMKITKTNIQKYNTICKIQYTHSRDQTRTTTCCPSTNFNKNHEKNGKYEAALKSV